MTPMMLPHGHRMQTTTQISHNQAVVMGLLQCFHLEISWNSLPKIYNKLLHLESVPLSQISINSNLEFDLLILHNKFINSLANTQIVLNSKYINTKQIV